MESTRGLIKLHLHMEDYQVGFRKIKEKQEEQLNYLYPL